MNSTVLFESLGLISSTCVEPLSWLVAAQIRDILKYIKKKKKYWNHYYNNADLIENYYKCNAMYLDCENFEAMNLNCESYVAMYMDAENYVAMNLDHENYAAINIDY